MMRLAINDLSVAIGDRAIVHGLTLDVPDAAIVGLVGPNGSGKSTALKCVYRALKPSGGTVWIGQTDLATLSIRENARAVAALTQEGSLDFDFTVEEIVALGRAPHLTGNQPLGEREKALCQEAMAKLDVLHLAGRGVLSLSGGERQRVFIARALVQEPQVLVLDEPTNHLDVRHQIDLLRLLKGSGLTVLVVLHDLNLAAAVCDRIGVLADGSLVAAGSPKEVLTTELVREVFGVEATIVPHPETGDPQLLYSLSTKSSQEESAV